MLGILFSVSYPAINHYRPAQFATQMVFMTKNAQSEIAKLLINRRDKPILLDAHLLIEENLDNKYLNEDVKIDFRYITKSGKIILYSKQIEVFIELTPYINNKSVTWFCKGHPIKNLPGDCRETS